MYIDLSVMTDGDILERYGLTTSALAALASVEKVVALQDKVLTRIESNKELSTDRKEQLSGKVIDKCQERSTGIEAALMAADPNPHRPRRTRARGGSALAGSPAIAAA